MGWLYKAYSVNFIAKDWKIGLQGRATLRNPRTDSDGAFHRPLKESTGRRGGLKGVGNRVWQGSLESPPRWPPEYAISFEISFRRD